MADGDVGNVRQVPRLPLARSTHVHHRQLAALHRAGRHPRRHFGGRHLRHRAQLPPRGHPVGQRVGGEVAAHPVQPDHRQLPYRHVHRLDRRREQVEVGVVRQEPSGPGGERLVERDVDGAGHVARRVVGGGTKVYHEGARLEELGQPRTVHLLGPPEAAEEGRALLVDALHLREVGGRLRLAGQHGTHELRLVGDREPPVEQLLVAQRGLRHRAERLAARRARAVARPELQPVRVLAEALQQPEERARAVLHGVGEARRALQQIRPPHVADEDEVAREGPHGPVGASGVGDDEGEVLRCVAGRRDHVDAHVAHHERVAVPHEDGVNALRAVVVGREPVLPVGVPLVREVEGGPRPVGELARAGHEVRVDVRLRHVRDAEPLVGRRAHVLLHVAVGVHHQGLASGRTPHQVARLGEAVVVEAPEKHGDHSRLRAWRAGWAPARPGWVSPCAGR